MFCHRCGEKRVNHEDFSLKKFGVHALDQLTHFDFKFFRSLWLLAVRPGFLTARYLEGNRKPYLKPLQLFILVNVVYFFLLHFIGWNTFASPLANHLDLYFYRDWAGGLVSRHLAATGLNRAGYEAAFNASTLLWSKSLIFLMIPMVALALTLLHVGSRRFVVEHLVTATHFMAWVLVFFMTVMNLIAFVIDVSGLRAHEGVVDAIGTYTVEAAFLFYVFRSLRTGYGSGNLASALRAIALTLAMYPIVQCYRFILFVVVYLAV
jgi:hypothetical protein